VRLGSVWGESGIRTAGPGCSHITEREREVLALMAEGRSNTSICERLTLSAKTVEGHVRNIFTKLGAGESADDHSWVLAVLSYLRSPQRQESWPRTALSRQRACRRQAVPAQKMRRGPRADLEPGLGQEVRRRGILDRVERQHAAIQAPPEGEQLARLVGGMVGRD